MMLTALPKNKLVSLTFASIFSLVVHLRVKIRLPKVCIKCSTLLASALTLKYRNIELSFPRTNALAFSSVAPMKKKKRFIPFAVVALTRIKEFFR
jgi:hypothetical protein